MRMSLKNIFRFLLCKRINIHEIEIDHQGKKYTRKGITGKYNLDHVEHTYFTRDLSAKNCIEGACGSRAIYKPHKPLFLKTSSPSSAIFYKVINSILEGTLFF
jgi:hypothetical protein